MEKEKSIYIIICYMKENIYVEKDMEKVNYMKKKN